MLRHHKTIIKFETSIGGQQVIGYAWMEYNNYCGDGKGEGDCPLLIIDYKFRSADTTSDQLYHIRYYEQMKDQTQITQVSDLQYFEEVKKILASMKLIHDSEQVRQNSDGSNSFSDAATGLTFNIPKNTKLIKNIQDEKRDTYSLYVSIEKIPVEDVSSLSCDSQNSCTQYEKNDIDITDTILLRQYEACNISFVRSANFYRKGYSYQIRLSASNMADQIIRTMPEYFGTDPDNCGDMNVWKDQNGFIQKLKTHSGKEPAQSWYDSFNLMIDSMQWE